MEKFGCIAVALMCVLSMFNAHAQLIVVARQGARTILPCGDQKHLYDVTSLSWIRISNNEVVFNKSEESDPVFPRPGKYSVSYSYQLEIFNVNVSDAGSYRCDYRISASFFSRMIELYVPEVYIEECIDIAESTCWVDGSSIDSLTCKLSGFPANIFVSWQRTPRPGDEEVLAERSFNSSGELVTNYDKERGNTSLVCRVTDGSGGNFSRYAPFEQAVQFLVPGNADVDGNKNNCTGYTPVIIMGVIIALLILIIIFISLKRRGTLSGGPGYSRDDIQADKKGYSQINQDPEPGASNSQGTGGIESDVQGEVGPSYSRDDIPADKKGYSKINQDPEPGASNSQGTGGIESDVHGKMEEPTGEMLEELQNNEWKLKANVVVYNSMNCMAATSDGRMAVGCSDGPHGIQIYSADGKVLQNVLKGEEQVDGIAFLSDGRCAVRSVEAETVDGTRTQKTNVSLYKPNWEKVDAIFNTLSLDEGGEGNLTVDKGDRIYVGYRKAKKIEVFTPAGGEPVSEIACDGNEPLQIFAMKTSEMMVVKIRSDALSRMNLSGKHFIEGQHIEKSADLYPAVCKDDTILIATVNKKKDRVSIDRYTSELQHVETLITDHVIDTSERGCTIQEFTSGEIAFFSAGRLYIFSKSVSLVGN